jgi:hypothetical protein
MTPPTTAVKTRARAAHGTTMISACDTKSTSGKLGNIVAHKRVGLAPCDRRSTVRHRAEV